MIELTQIEKTALMAVCFHLTESGENVEDVYETIGFTEHDISYESGDAIVPEDAVSVMTTLVTKGAIIADYTRVPYYFEHFLEDAGIEFILSQDQEEWYKHFWGGEF